jgi:hypothetical protein
MSRPSRRELDQVRPAFLSGSWSSGVSRRVLVSKVIDPEFTLSKWRHGFESRWGAL